MREADIPRYAPHKSLMGGEGVPMHEAHGNAADALIIDPLQRLANLIPRRPTEHPYGLPRQAPDEVLALSALIANLEPRLGDDPSRILGVVLQRDTLIDLDDLLIQDVWLPDGEIKDLWPRLVSYGQTVPEALCDDHGDPLALALEQGVGGDGGAHADGLDGGGVEGLAAGNVSGEEVLHDAPDALERGVGVVGRVLGQELQHDVLAIARADTVGKGAAAVDGDADAPGCHFVLSCVCGLMAWKYGVRWGYLYE